MSGLTRSCSDRHSHDLVRQLFFGRPSIYDLAQRPLGTVLDLGCGDGAWICDAAHAWRNTRFFGLDIQNLHPSRAQLVADLGETADNIKFTYFNFLMDKLPYLDDRFDLVRMANLKWAIPEDKVDFVAPPSCDTQLTRTRCSGTLSWEKFIVSSGPTGGSRSSTTISYWALPRMARSQRSNVRRATSSRNSSRTCSRLAISLSTRAASL